MKKIKKIIITIILIVIMELNKFLIVTENKFIIIKELMKFFNFMLGFLALI